jgi:hypothetical protein
MQCIVTYATDKYSYQKLVLRYTFLIFVTLSSGHYIYMSKEWKICRYFSAPKRGPRAKNVWETLVCVNEINQLILKITYSFQFVK